MKRLHIHVSVEILAPWVRFYSTLIAAEPAVRKNDCAKWEATVYGDSPALSILASAEALGCYAA